MTDPATNAPELSVSDLAGALKRAIEDAFGRVRLRGEISGYRGPVGSGHVYFSLKDEGARIDAVIWKGVFARLRFRPEEGMEVIATGKVTTFPGGSRYQIVIDNLEPAGVGALMALLEERRRKLGAEGLFDPERKQLLPYLPEVIGVVTSPTGAVIRDILHRLSDRFPRRVIVWPVRVQGETSAGEVAAAIRGFNALQPGGPIPRPDVLIVARGGGSLEDLWSFNEEIVVRAAAESDIPLISAVGHETDTTLIDFAADVRAPTPTAAAEMAVPVRAELMAGVRDLGARLAGGALRRLDRNRTEFRGAARALPGPDALLGPRRQRLDIAGVRAAAQIRNVMQRRRQGLIAAARRLQAQTPEARLARFSERVRGLESRMRSLVQTRRERAAERFNTLQPRLAPAFAKTVEMARRDARRHRERIVEIGGRLHEAALRRIAARRDRFSALGALLHSLGYKQVLARGFAVVRGGDDRPIRRAAGVTQGMALRIEFADKSVEAVAGPGGDVPTAHKARPQNKPPREGGGPAGGQGTLF